MRVFIVEDIPRHTTLRAAGIELDQLTGTITAKDESSSSRPKRAGRAPSPVETQPRSTQHRHRPCQPRCLPPSMGSASTSEITRRLPCLALPSAKSAGAAKPRISSPYAGQHRSLPLPRTVPLLIMRMKTRTVAGMPNFGPPGALAPSFEPRHGKGPTGRHLVIKP